MDRGGVFRIIDSRQATCFDHLHHFVPGHSEQARGIGHGVERAGLSVEASGGAHFEVFPLRRTAGRDETLTGRRVAAL